MDFHDEVYLHHIYDSILKIEAYAKIGEDKFFAESHWQDAIIRQLEILGEASKKLSKKFREDYKDIPWKRMAGLRDILIHEYFGVDLNAIWQIVERNIPQLKDQISKIVTKIN